RPGPGLTHQAERGREQVTVVAGPELLAGDGERGAGDATGQQVEAGEATPVLVVDVPLDDLPFRAAVEAQGLAGVRVELHHGLVREAGLFQAERLPAGPGADLQRHQPVHNPSSLAITATVCPPAPPRRGPHAGIVIFPWRRCQPGGTGCGARPAGRALLGVHVFGQPEWHVTA